MTKNKTARWLFIKFILFSLCFFAACSEPVGNLDGSGNGNGNGGGNGGSVMYDFLMLRPNRILYDADGGANGRFDRSADLRIFLADNGEFKSIDPSDSGLTLEVIENPGLTSETVTVINNGYHPFSIPGRYIIRGTYGSNIDEYSIEVRGSFVNPGEGSDFVDIIWL
ncbi:MAG: hypothetical protein FWC21_03340 [Treponema sp.]|nr:hypothetical protein [Treponema sp.]